MNFSTRVSRTLVVTVALFVLCVGSIMAQVNFTGPQPGDVYREYTVVMDPNGNSWRVTDPNTDITRYPSVQYDLPNPINHIQVSDLTGAIKAEAVLSMWGGHVGTKGDAIRFNGNSWISIPELASINGIPDGHLGHNYMTQPMVTIPVPLSNLVSGTNAFEATNTGQDPKWGWGWGMFGLYEVMIRVYYDPASKPHPTGYISSPANTGIMAENPTITTAITGGNVDRVDILGSYYGYDTDGDGISTGYHYDYILPTTYGTMAMEIHNHVGTATSAPWQVVWNTQYVPDQVAGGVKLIARIHDASGIWYCSPEVTNLSLARTGTSVQMFQTTLGERAWTTGETGSVTVTVNVPSASNITSAVYQVRSYNMTDVDINAGDYDWRRFNSWDDSKYGGRYYYSYDVRSIPTNQVVAGTNTFSFYASVIGHHGVEILWPGPALFLQYTGNYSSPVPLTSALASPASGSTEVETSPVLAWNPTPGGTSYQLQVSADPGFGSTAFDQSNLTDTTKQINNLTPLATYYWRVRATGPGGTGPYSSVFSFTTKLGAPTHVAPPNTASSVPTSATIRWQQVPGATGYQLQVSTDPTFATGLVVDNPSVADTSYQATGLVYGTQYYWHVKANGVVGGYSNPWSFTTIVGPAATPVLVSPVNGTQGLAIASIDFSWQVAQWASTYRLQIATDPTFTSGIAFDDSTISSNARSVTGLLTDRVYYWRVRGKGVGGTGNFSSPWSFETVRTIPLAAWLVYPANGASGQPVLGMTFRWGKIATATLYGFQLGTDSTFATGLVKNDSAEVDTTRTVNGLKQSTRYFWRVRGRNNAGWGPFSPTWYMNTVVPLPGPVSLIGPAADATVAGDSVAFTWSRPTPAATRYYFEIALDPAFTSFRTIDSTVTDTVKFFRPPVPNQAYYWRVKGWNEGGWGSLSESRMVHVILSSVDDHRQGLPATFALDQNHPNPFNPATKISFSLPRATLARLEVYNMLGQKVATLMDDHMEAGYYTVTFDASAMPSGVYLYRLVTSGGSLVRKMILMK